MKKIILVALLAVLIVAGASAFYPWDVFRPVVDFAESFNFLTRVLVFLLSGGMAVIAFRAYEKNKSRRFLFVCAAFALFAVKWGLKVLDLFVSPGYFLNDPSENIFELGILLMLFMAIFHK